MSEALFGSAVLILPEGAEVRIDVAGKAAEDEIASANANGNSSSPGSMY